MFKYIFKRIFIFIPTLLAISLLTFILSNNAPGDPVETMLKAQNDQGQAANLQANEKAYLEKRAELGLDLPIFYFALSNTARPDTLHYLAKRSHRDNLERLIYQYGNWDKIQSYYQNIRQMELQTASVLSDSLNADALIAVRSQIQKLYIEPKPDLTRQALDSLQFTIKGQSSLATLQPALTALQNADQTMQQTATRWKNFVPSFKWYGLHNQYHRWFFGDRAWFGEVDSNKTFGGFIRGDFGKSYSDSRPVASKIGDAIRWTMLISFLSILITYLVAIPLGVSSAISKGSLKDQVITTSLFMLYSIPSFWIATLLIMFFGGGDYLDWFPPYGVGGDLAANAGFFAQLKDRAMHLVMPLICWTYDSFAYLSRQMRGGMLNVLRQDYIRTARSKGLPENKIVWKHAFRNSLLPIITLFSSVFPLMISGAIALEIIFSIPGMGKMAYEALIARDYPVVFTVMMFSSILTLVGYLVSDILYAIVDPRITFSDSK